MKSCPCLSGLSYKDCCEPFIKGKKHPRTAEALMRSRYTAYVKHAIDYIVKTCFEEGKEKIDVKQTRRWSESSTWLGLKILSVEKGGVNDTEGMVEFEASYEIDKLKERHYEKANFKKVDDRWFYIDGDVRPATVVRSGPKLGRNETCPCASGKKYKHCCAK